MTKEMQLLIKLGAVRKQLASTEGTRESIGQGIEDFLKWYKSEANTLNTQSTKE